MGRFEAYAALLYQLYGVSFLILGVVGLVLPRRDATLRFAPHLRWLALFGLLHGVQELVELARLDGASLPDLYVGRALLFLSFLALFEFGRRAFALGLRASLVYSALAVLGALVLGWVGWPGGLEVATRYLLGVPGALMAGLALLSSLRDLPGRLVSAWLPVWLRVGGGAFLGYSALSLFLSQEVIPSWLPTQAHFVSVVGLPVQLWRALCAGALTLAFVELVRQASSVSTHDLLRVIDTIDGFVYRCNNDRDWSVVYMTSGVEQLSGYPASDFLRQARSWGSLIHPEDAEAARSQVQAALGSRQDFELSYRITTRSGEPRWVLERGRGVFEEGGKLRFLEGHVTNNTNRVLLINELRESEKRFRALFEQAAVGVAQIDAVTGRFLRVNRYYCGFLGYSEEEMKKLDFQTITHPEDLAEDLAKMERLRAGEIDSFTMEKRLFRRGGAVVWISLTVSPLWPKGAPPDFHMAVVHDLTARKQLEGQLLQAQKMDAIGRLAGGIAHDLNNLLTPILGFGEMLAEDVEDEAYKAEAREIVSAALRAREMIQQLLAFSRKQLLAFKPIQLNALLTNFERLLRRTIREDIALRFCLAPDLPALQGDTGQLEQVLMNLAVNSQDSMPEGGTITISTSLVELDDLSVAAHPGVTPGRYLALEFSDTGQGMDPETKEHIFEPFFTKKGQFGTGLGLATVYGIITQHNGHIRVYSEPHNGTSFTIYLPADTRSLPAPLEGAVASLTPGGSETILLAEDNALVRDLARSLLTKQGYQVLAAEDGPHALSLLASHQGPVHLLLTDVVMPQMNGKALFQKIRETHPEIKVVYMSGYPADVIAHRGVLEEKVQFLQKPFTTKSLAQKIREALRQDG